MRSTRGITGLSMVAGFLALALPASAGTVFYGPSTYKSFTDSPFSSVSFAGGYFSLETFEDGLLNTAGVVASAGIVAGPGAQTDSVDGDDGTIDGSGAGGHSFYIGTTSTLTFTFSAAVLGNLPTYAGLVWTDIGNVTSGSLGFGDVTFEAFDSGGASLGTIGPASVGDGSANGGTEEDRFFGVFSSGGISKITMTMANSIDWEVDHLQYGFVPPPVIVPEPSSLALLAVGGLGLLAINRRRARRA